MSLKIENLTFSYENSKHHVFHDFSLFVEQGECIGILGHNGAGKSTLLKLILGILKPSRGVLTLDQVPISQQKNKIGYVPQFKTFQTDFPMTGDELFKLMFSVSQYEKKHLDFLEKYKVLSLLPEQLGTLSGGELQRILFARAMVQDPSLLLLDEPHAHLDQDHENDFFSLLKVEKKKRTILIISHDPECLEEMVDRVIRIGHHHD